MPTPIYVCVIEECDRHRDGRSRFCGRHRRKSQKCVICDLDHVIPLSRGGTNWPANLSPACAPCNLHKGANPYIKEIV